MKFLIDNNLSPLLAEALNQAAIILANLQSVAEGLAVDAVVVLGDDRLRIRRLPLPG